MSSLHSRSNPSSKASNAVRAAQLRVAGNRRNEPGSRRGLSVWLMVLACIWWGANRITAKPAPATASPQVALEEPDAKSAQNHETTPAPSFTEPPAAMLQDAPMAPHKALGGSQPMAELILEPAENGNYFAEGEINKQKVTFVIDTGASRVSVPERLARQLGLQRGNYLPTATAAGIVGVYETNIKHLTLGPIDLRNVSGTINPDSPDEVVLLGMSALSQMRLVQQNGNLALQQATPLQPETASSADADPPTPSIRRSVKACMGDNKVVDAQVLRCMQAP